MEVFQVIVVGAGPAGAQAATILAREGIDVLLLEKATLPREKPCGGALSLRARELVSATIEPVVERVVREATFTLGGRDPLAVRSDVPLAYLVDRSRFDYLLVRQAESLGVTVRTGYRVEEVEEDSRGVTVRAGGRTWRAQFAIAADGAFSRTARLLGLKLPRLRGAPTLSLRVRRPDWWPERGVLVDYGVVSFGYAWVFPKGEHLDVGLGSFRAGRDLERPWRDWLEILNLAGQPGLGRPRRWVLPVGPGQGVRQRGRVLLAGDAAALANPFTGEGLYQALLSGQLAGLAVAEAVLRREGEVRGYSQALAARLFPELRGAARLQRAFYAFPGFFHRYLHSHRELLSYGLRVLDGSVGYEQLWRLLRTALRIRG